MVLGAYAVEAQGVKRILLLRRGEGRRFVLAPRRFLRKLSRALLLRHRLGTRTCARAKSSFRTT